jgi:hypothetical protein
VAEQQCPDERTAALGVGPADDDKLRLVEAFGLAPEPAIARAVGGIQPLRNDAFETERADLPVKRRTLPDLVIAVADRVLPALE